jgi:hypothetical protein
MREMRRRLVCGRSEWLMGGRHRIRQRDPRARRGVHGLRDEEDRGRLTKRMATKSDQAESVTSSILWLPRRDQRVW